MRFISLLQPGSSSGNSGLNGIFFPCTRELFIYFFLSGLFFIAAAERTTTDKGRKQESCGSDFPFYLWRHCVAKCKNRSQCWQFRCFLISGWHFGAPTSTTCEEQCPRKGIGWRLEPDEWGDSQEIKGENKTGNNLQFVFLGGDTSGWILLSWNSSQRDESCERWERRLGARDTAKSSQRRIWEISL